MSRAAVDLALAVFKDPGLLADIRERPPAEDIGKVIRIAAGEAAAREAAAASSGTAVGEVVEACVFFLQQTLFAPGGDSYRVLGVRPDAPQERLREHYRWLMKWLHPDRNPDGWEALYADRVNVAWQDLKTPGRRAEYDRRAPLAAHAMVSVPPAGWRLPAADQVARGPWLSGRIVRNLPAIVLATLAAFAMLVVGATYWARAATERERIAREAARDRPETPAQPMAEAGMPPRAEREVADAGLSQANGAASPAVNQASLAWDDEPTGGVGREPALAVGTDAKPAAAPTTPSPPAETIAKPSSGDGVAVAAQAAAPNATGPDIPASPGRAGDGAGTTPAPASSAASARAIVRSEPAAATVRPAGATDAPAPAAPGPAPAALATAQAADQDVAEVRPRPGPAPATMPTEPAGAEAGAPEAAMATQVDTRSRMVEPVAVSQLSLPPPEPASIAPVRESAEALMREFVAAYAAGDRSRFDRLLSTSGRGQATLVDMRRRLDTTEMRFLEISQVQWRLDSDSARASTHFRDTYVPRGSRKAVTEAGRIDWDICIENGDHRIAGIERNAWR